MTCRIVFNITVKWYVGHGVSKATRPANNATEIIFMLWRFYKETGMRWNCSWTINCCHSSIIPQLMLKGFIMDGCVLLTSTPECVVSPRRVIPRAHGFCFAVLCCGYTLTDFPISIRLTSLALWQSNDCPSASKATLMNMDKYFMWIHYERLHNRNKAKHNKTVCIFLGIYCTCGGKGPERTYLRLQATFEGMITFNDYKVTAPVSFLIAFIGDTSGMSYLIMLISARYI